MTQHGAGAILPTPPGKMIRIGPYGGLRVSAMYRLDPIFRSEETAPIGVALRRFVTCNPVNTALAGSLAMAAQLAAIGRAQPGRRPGDIDLVSSSLDQLASAIAAAFISPHVHAAAGLGRLIAQFVHPLDAVRIDVFRAVGTALDRATPFRFGTGTISILSIEDQAARAASLCMKLARGGRIAAKHVRDLQWLS